MENGGDGRAQSDSRFCGRAHAPVHVWCSDSQADYDWHEHTRRGVCAGISLQSSKGLSREIGGFRRGWSIQDEQSSSLSWTDVRVVGRTSDRWSCCAVREAGSSHLAPPMSQKWIPLSRWRTEYMGRWGREEHINALELRTIVNLVRHLARSKQCWNRKVLCFTDSMVSLGAAGKGRSSSPSLLALCRRLCALRLITGIRIYLRHVPSELNHTDGPSRGGPCGCDEETVKKHAQRLETRRGQG